MVDFKVVTPKDNPHPEKIEAEKQKKRDAINADLARKNQEVAGAAPTDARAPGGMGPAAQNEFHADVNREMAQRDARRAQQGQSRDGQGEKTPLA